jgi:gliding motility-associated-like protein
MSLNREIHIFAPNVFSPNGDANNDFFTLFAKEGIVLKINVLQIYNRWGGLVFANNDFGINEPQKGWDGKMSGEMQQQGIYVWRAEVTLYDGSTKQVSGDIMLLGD